MLGPEPGWNRVWGRRDITTGKQRREGKAKLGFSETRGPQRQDQCVSGAEGEWAYEMCPPASVCLQEPEDKPHLVSQ